MNLQKLLSKTEPEPNTGCFLWTGSGERYGRVLYKGTNQYAHRVAYELVFGTVPAGMNVLHHCHVGLCINPDHLYAGTQSENHADMMFAGREKPHKRGVTHCPYGHEYTPENTYRFPRTGSRVCKTCRSISDQMRVRPHKGGSIS